MSEPTTRPRILVLDDEPMILQILKASFERKEWDVEYVGEGREALRRHRERPFDLMIVDKNLPDIDGIALVRELRHAGDAVRIVMITGYGTVASAVESLNLGVAAYLEKPLRRITEVAATVEAALARPVEPAAPTTRPRIPVPRSVRARRAAPVEPVPDAAPDTDDGEEDFDSKVLTGRWRRPAVATGTVIVGSGDEGVRAALGAVVGEAHCQVAYAATIEEMLVALASHEPLLAVLEGGLGRPETLVRLRVLAPDVPCAVFTTGITMDGVKELMRLHTMHLVTDLPTSDTARQQLADLLRQLTAAGAPTRT